MAKVNIEGLDVVDVLVALWEHSRMQGMSVLGQYSTVFTKSMAQKEIEENDGRLDYVNGKVIKCDLPFGAKEFDPWGYDRDNGQGAAQRVIDDLKRKA